MEILPVYDDPAICTPDGQDAGGELITQEFLQFAQTNLELISQQGQQGSVLFRQDLLPDQNLFSSYINKGINFFNSTFGTTISRYDPGLHRFQSTLLMRVDDQNHIEISLTDLEADGDIDNAKFVHKYYPDAADKTVFDSESLQYTLDDSWIQWYGDSIVYNESSTKEGDTSKVQFEEFLKNIFVSACPAQN